MNGKTRVDLNVYRDGVPSLAVREFSITDRTHVPSDAYLTVSLEVDTSKLLAALTDGREVCVSVCMECRKAYRLQVIDEPGKPTERITTTHGYCAPCQTRMEAEADAAPAYGLRLLDDGQAEFYKK